MPEDAADRHVARWRNHWVLEDGSFDETVEAIVTRMSSVMHFLREEKRAAATAVGLQMHEYETLHSLMIRDTPGIASPTSLAADLGVSPAGMSGRLETMERAGHVRRVPDPTDRRRMGVEATDAGLAIWREAMAMREQTEYGLLDTLSNEQRTILSRLLKELTLAIEDGGGRQATASPRSSARSSTK